MKQPTKDVLREQLVLAAEEIIRQREEINRVRETSSFLYQCVAHPSDLTRATFDEAFPPRRWWHRFAWWRK